MKRYIALSTQHTSNKVDSLLERLEGLRPQIDEILDTAKQCRADGIRMENYLPWQHNPNNPCISLYEKYGTYKLSLCCRNSEHSYNKCYMFYISKYSYDLYADSVYITFDSPDYPSSYKVLDMFFADFPDFKRKFYETVEVATEEYEANQHLFHHSFHNNSKSKDEIIKFLKSTNKPIKYTNGFKSKHPSIYMKPISLEEALKIAERYGYLDVDEKSDYIDMNEYNSNDLW